MLSFVSR